MQLLGARLQICWENIGGTQSQERLHIAALGRIARIVYTEPALALAKVGGTGCWEGFRVGGLSVCPEKFPEPQDWLGLTFWKGLCERKQRPWWVKPSGYITSGF